MTTLEEPLGLTVFSGRLHDQATPFGMLIRVRDLGLTPVSVNRVELTHVNPYPDD